MLRDLVTLTF